jgi:hypothetical protein
MKKRRRKKALKKSQEFYNGVMARLGGNRSRKRGPRLTWWEIEISDRKPKSG